MQTINVNAPSVLSSALSLYQVSGNSKDDNLVKQLWNNGSQKLPFWTLYLLSDVVLKLTLGELFGYVTKLRKRQGL